MNTAATADASEAAETGDSAAASMKLKAAITALLRAATDEDEELRRRAGQSLAKLGQVQPMRCLNYLHICLLVTYVDR